MGYHLQQMFRIVVQILVGIALVGLLGCVEKQVSGPGSVQTSQTKVQTTEADAVSGEKVRVQLMEDAGELADREEWTKALTLYNILLADGSQDTAEILPSLEDLLARVPGEVLLPLLDNPDSRLPKDKMLYWTGVNLAREEAWENAFTHLNQFVETYPNHPDAAEALELLSIIRQTRFKKEVIGCLLPLSGKYGVYGQRALKGIQLAIQDYSKRYNRSFRVIIKDTQSDPAVAVAAVDSLHQEKVMAIVGPLLAVEAAGQRAQELGIPMVALTQKSEFPMSGDYLFSNFLTPEMQVQTLAAYAFLELGIKRVAVFYPEERYGERYRELFWDAVDLFEGQMVGVESYDGRKTDFTKSIRKLTGEAYPLPEYIEKDLERQAREEYFLNTQVVFNQPAPPVKVEKELEFGPQPEFPEEKEEKVEIQFEALFIPDDASRINLILPQLAYNDATNIYLLGTNLWNKPSLLKETRGYNRNTIIIDGYFGKSKRPATARFDKAFREMFDDAPGFLEAVSYDTAAILFESAMADGVSSRKDIRDVLTGHRIFEGVTGTTIFDENGQARKQLFLLTIKRNRFTEIYN